MTQAQRESAVRAAKSIINQPGGGWDYGELVDAVVDSAAMASAPQPSELVEVREEIRLVVDMLDGIAHMQTWDREVSAGERRAKCQRYAELLRREDKLRAAQPAQATPVGSSEIDIVFDGPPSHESGRFVEVECDGKGINFGEWVHREDGYWVLRFAYPPIAAPIADATAKARADAFEEAVSYFGNCDRFAAWGCTAAIVDELRKMAKVRP